jgi:signal peptidase II
MTAGAETQRRSRLHLLGVLLATAAVVTAVDHLTKWLVTSRIALDEQVPSSGPITIHYVQNRGAAFSLFPDLQWLFLGVAAVVCAYILIAGHRFGGQWTQVVLGLVLGGAVSNAIDRAAQGYVVDFVDVHRWPVFNVADSCIVVGIIAAVLFIGRDRTDAKGAS